MFGVRIVLLCPRGSFSAEVEKCSGIEHVHLEHYCADGLWISRFILGLVYWFKLLRRFHPCVVIHNIGVRLPLRLTTHLHGVPYVRFQRFAPDAAQCRKYWLSNGLPDLTILPSQTAEKSFLACTKSFFRGRRAVVYNPQDTYRLMDEKVCEVSPSSSGAMEFQFALRIGIFSRLVPGKGLEFLTSLATFLYGESRDVLFIVAGQPTETAESVDFAKRFTSSIADLPNVRLVGYLSPPERYMAACDLIFSASESESFGRTLVEAWSVGVPTLTSDIPAFQELVCHSSGGLLFRLNDLADCCDKLNKLRNAELRRELGEKGRAWVAKELDPERYAERFMELVEEVIETKRHRHWLTLRREKRHGGVGPTR